MFAEQAAKTALNEALFAYSMQEVAKVRPTDRFVHYTSADVAAKIIGGDSDGKRSLWLRDSRLMNDFTEVEWGQQCLAAAFRSWRLHDRFKRVLDAIDTRLYQNLSNALLDGENTLAENAYLFSLSIHNAQECRTGKLSMWRAYGGEHSICLVFNTQPLLTYQSAHELVMSPVMYGEPTEFTTELETLVHRLEQRIQLIRRVSSDDILLYLKRAFEFAVLSTKHPGFCEETEWRIIHRHSNLRPDPPFIVDPEDKTKRIYQIPLENRIDANLYGIEIGEVLDRVIVGPIKNMDKHDSIIASYVDLLKNAGISNPEDRVLFCGIPLRRKGVKG